MARNDLSPYSRRLMPSLPTAAPARSSMSRSRTPEEAMAALYVGVARTRTAAGVTAYALDSLGVIAGHRRQLVEEFPEVSALADLLLTNAVRVMGQIQNSVSEDDTQVIV